MAAPMSFALLVTAPPFSSQGSATALRFARSLINNGHRIVRIFFFRDGVHNASYFAITPQDETNIPAAWQQFCRDNGIDAVACVSSALKRGILDQRESERHHLPTGNIADGIQIGGLGLLTDALLTADRVITFG